MTLRYLALGDSYTIGEGVTSAQRWPVKLSKLLRERGVEVDDPTIVAKTGWTTAELRSAIDTVAGEERFDLVSLLVGVNDQYRGYDVERYQRDFSEVLTRAIALGGGHASRVIVVSIPDWSVTPFAEGRDRRRISAEIDVFNSVNAGLATAAGAQRVDITTSSRDVAQDAALLVSDGLHPGPALYDRWAELVLPAALAALS